MMEGIQVWGGVECTVNRIGEQWHDQMELGGHARRLDDLDLIAALGIRTLRYPILWERTASESPEARTWDWADERLSRLRALSITPIVGLVHHGSGPRYTGLLEDNFAAELARFAGAVAARYPWVDRYTPINEPLTTARFSALYGLWYPHHRRNDSFARALINQCRAIVLSMKAIRRINPAAQLVQTEDMGTTYSAPHMAYQRDFDNERRWLTWDLLCGRVDHDHALRAFLEASGITPAELDAFVADPCPPQLLGLNHYVTSDRFLDERIALYPARSHGTNGIEPYADLDAVRVLPAAYRGWEVIDEVWQRYGRPIALTEVHMGCTREEQLRWFEEALHAAARARARGCEVRAITAWSLFGAYHWNTLLTRTDGHYEPGAFDVRSAAPRPTALAKRICAYNAGGHGLASHLDVPGWWQRPEKALYKSSAAGHTPALSRRRRPQPRPLLLCGATGRLGRALAEACQHRSLRVRALSRSELDIASPAAVRATCEEFNPWAIVNAAGYARVDEAEHYGAQCVRENLYGPMALAAAAHARDVPFLTFSSDLVFGGYSTAPYLESSPTGPLNAYGRCKLAAESKTLAYPTTLCVRTAALFGARGGGDFLSKALAALQGRKDFIALSDVIVSPTYLPDLAHASLDLLIDGCAGLVHLTNQGALSWAKFASCGAEALGVSTECLVGKQQKELNLPARRPLYSALGSERVGVMPTLEDALARYASSMAEPEDLASPYSDPMVRAG